MGIEDFGDGLRDDVMAKVFGYIEGFGDMGNLNIYLLTAFG